jgi:hypothetical protein
MGAVRSLTQMASRRDEREQNSQRAAGSDGSGDENPALSLVAFAACESRGLLLLWAVPGNPMVLPPFAVLP